LGTIASSLARRLGGEGARVTLLHHPEESGQAREANAAEVDVYLGIRIVPDSTESTCAYYQGYSYESPAGRDLANRIAQAIPTRLSVPASAAGMSLAILRETQMPAVVIEFGPTEMVVERGSILVEVLLTALSNWASATSEGTTRTPLSTPPE
jgi:N-acetylmuramoyl-L-alanine amidase